MDDAVQFPDRFAKVGDHSDELPNVQKFFEAMSQAETLATENDRCTAYSGSGQLIVINKQWGGQDRPSDADNIGRNDCYSRGLQDSGPEWQW